MEVFIIVIVISLVSFIIFKVAFKKPTKINSNKTGGGSKTDVSKKDVKFE
jgi:hypothetical protein